MKNFKFIVSEPTKPVAKKLTQEDVWGAFNHETGKTTSYGMRVAQGYGMPDGKYFTEEKYQELRQKLTDICPVWAEYVPYKSVTVICAKEQQDEVEYWLGYVHGGNSISKVKDIAENKVAIRSDYKCW